MSDGAPKTVASAKRIAMVVADGAGPGLSIVLDDLINAAKREERAALLAEIVAWADESAALNSLDAPAVRAAFQAVADVAMRDAFAQRSP